MDFNEIKAAMAERDGAIADRLGGIEKALQEHSEKWQTLEDLQSRQSSPGRTGERENEMHVKLFCDWIRKPRDGGKRQALGDFQEKMLGKSLSVGTAADGGFAVPEQIGRDVEKLEIKLSPVRDLVRVVKTSTGDYKELLTSAAPARAGLVRTGSRTETNTPQLRERAPTFGELYGYPKTTEWALDDVFFDVRAWLTNAVAEQFAKYEGDAVIRGNGSNKPTGMLDTTPVTTADDASPKRAAAAYQYILGADDLPAAVDADSIIDLSYSLNSTYRAGASWAMNSTTAGQVRKLKDPTTGLYLWQPALAAGQPNMLLGYPVALWEQMDDPLGGKFPIAFGNFRRGYLLADRSEIRVTLDNITTPGYVKFYVRRREGGCVLNNDLLKWLKLL